MKVKIGICASCIGRQFDKEETTVSSISEELKNELSKHRPDIEWEIEGQSCFRFCPEGKIAMSIPRVENLARGRASMSKDLSIESMVTQILRENY